VADLETGAAVTVDMRFRAGSFGKTLVATVVLQLAAATAGGGRALGAATELGSCLGLVHAPRTARLERHLRVR
jgi:hypothetical protein